MDLSPYSDPADINAMDEVAQLDVVHATNLDVGSMREAPRRSARRPSRSFPIHRSALASGSFCTLDSRAGQRYEIGIDPQDRPPRCARPRR
jgi:hypothetical protein